MTAEAGTTAPLSVAQEALWYASRLSPNRLSYNEAISLRRDGPLDVAALRRAFDELVRRHEAWRTTFDVVDARPVQRVHPPAPFELALLDLSHLSDEEAEQRAVQLVADVAKVLYDVRRGPLVRPRLVRFPNDHHRLYLALHHLVFDGVIMSRVVLPELAALYDAFAAGEPSPLAEPAYQYADYAAWEQEWITSPRVARRMQHWRRRLDTAPTLALPLDHPRPEVPRYRGGVLPVALPVALVDRLREVGQDAGATLYQVLATTWALLLGRYSGQQDVVFATPAGLRQRPELEAVVGYCVTPVVLRVALDGDPSFAALVVRVRNELLDGLDHLVPFERVVRELRLDARSSANPVYQAMIVLEPAPVHADPSWSLQLMESEIGDAVGTTKLDLELQLDQRPGGHVAGRLIFDSDLMERATAARLLAHWRRLVDAAAADPSASVDAIAMLTPAEVRRELVTWNATATDTPPGALHHRIAARAAQQPDAPAVADAERALSYRELDEQAEAGVSAAGPRASDATAPPAAASVAWVLDALAALKAGAAPSRVDPAPAGAAATLGAELGLGPADTVLALPATLSALPVAALWAPLLAGARVVVASEEDAADGTRLSRLIAAEQVSVLAAKPAAWQALVDTGLRDARSLRALSGGGHLTRALADELCTRCRVLWNAYATAETIGCATLGLVEPTGPVTIGRPLANTRAYVCDGAGRPVALGAFGELLLAGDGVDTRERAGATLVADPGGAGRALRTGERARRLPDGRIALERS